MDQKSAKEKTMSESKIPQKNSSQWKKNETTIRDNPALKMARDTAEGINKPAGHYKQTHGGKGSAPRTNYLSDQYADNYDKIFKKGKYAEKSDD